MSSRESVKQAIKMLSGEFGEVKGFALIAVLDPDKIASSVLSGTMTETAHLVTGLQAASADLCNAYVTLLRENNQNRGSANEH